MAAFGDGPVQAHDLDLDFYGRLFRPGACLRSHAEHMQRWHDRPEACTWASTYAAAKSGSMSSTWARPDVLLIVGVGNPAEAFKFQLHGLSDRYRLTAYDNRGMGRSPLAGEAFSVRTLGDDAAAILRALEPSAPRRTVETLGGRRPESPLRP